MLDRYENYLKNIRNNLIQCGVEVPVRDTKDYFSICALEVELSDILWFYRVLSISGSEGSLKDFFLPLNGYFNERIRGIYYKEFIDFLADYKNLGVEELRGKYLSERGDVYRKTKHQQDEDTVEEESRAVEEAKEEDESPIEEASKTPTKKESQTSMEDSPFGDNLAVDSPDSPYVSHGVYLEDLLEEENSESASTQEDSDSGKEESTPETTSDDMYVSHGVYLEDLLAEDENKEETGNEDYSDDDSQDGLGSYDEEEEWDKEEEIDWDALEDDNSQDGLGSYEEEYPEEDEEEEINWDELESDDSQDGLGSYSEEDEEDSDSDEEEIDWDALEGDDSQDGLGNYSEEDEYEEEEDEIDWDALEGDDSQDGLGNFSEEEDEEEEEAFDWDALYAEAEEEENSENGEFEDSDEETYGEDVNIPSTEPQTGIPSENPKPKQPERDLSDALQDFINGSLTSARNSIRSIKNRKK